MDGFTLAGIKRVAFQNAGVKSYFWIRCNLWKNPEDPNHYKTNDG